MVVVSIGLLQYLPQTEAKKADKEAEIEKLSTKIDQDSTASKKLNEEVAVLQKELAKYDHKKPMVLGAYGCGQLWRYKPESKDGKIPKPSFWVEPSPPSCELVQKNAGLCGGYGVWYSVGAINQLIAREHGSMQEFDTIWRKYPPTIQVDTGTSCILLESAALAFVF